MEFPDPFAPLTTEVEERGGKSMEFPDLFAPLTEEVEERLNEVYAAARDDAHDMDKLTPEVEDYYDKLYAEPEFFVDITPKEKASLEEINKNFGGW